ncbi:MAG: hypothetical protein GF307_03790 [candidate division Zixibacteria bacterium]|nr:hypothetical protein [candidate division Zixibacteria bacterium]
MSTKILSSLLIISLIFNVLAAFAGYKAYRMIKDNRQLYDVYFKLKYDIPGIGHYKDKNIALMKENPDDPERIVFFGASITERWDFDKYFPGKSYVNRGAGGQYASQMVGRFYQDVLDLKPKSTIIKICAINLDSNLDIKQSTDAVRAMIDLAEAHNIEPIMATVIPVTEGYDKSHPDTDYTGKIKDLNRWIESYAAKRNLRIVDYFGYLSDSMGYLEDEYSDDGLHPNDKGYDQMAKAVYAVLGK